MAHPKKGSAGPGRTPGHPPATRPRHRRRSWPSRRAGLRSTTSSTPPWSPSRPGPAGRKGASPRRTPARRQGPGHGDRHPGGRRLPVVVLLRGHGTDGGRTIGPHDQGVSHATTDRPRRRRSSGWRRRRRHARGQPDHRRPVRRSRAVSPSSTCASVYEPRLHLAPALPPPARARCPSASTTRCGSRTPTSTSTGTSATSPCPRPGGPQRADRPGRPARAPSRSTAPGRCGRCGSSTASTTATSACSPRSTTPPSTARRATSSRSPSSTSTPIAGAPARAEEWTPDRVPTDTELLGLRRPARWPAAGAAWRGPSGARVDAALTVRERNRLRPLEPAAVAVLRARAPRSTGRSRRSGASPSPRCRCPTSRRSRTRSACTVNDVVLALCAGALRRYFDDRGEHPDGPLVAMVPVSVRTEDEKGAHGQPGVSMLLTSLATDVDDPVERLQVIHECMPRGQGAAARHRRRHAAATGPSSRRRRSSGRAARLYSRTQHGRPAPARVQRHHLQRARPAVPALLGRRPGGRQLPDGADLRRRRAEHDA